MSTTRHRSAWIWLAIAAITFASLARVQAGIDNARAFATPVLALLSVNQDTSSQATHAARMGFARASRPCAATVWQSAGTDLWMALFPVLFVGIVAPLSLLSPRSLLCLGHPPATPLLPFSFQRPPPAQLL